MTRNKRGQYARGLSRFVGLWMMIGSLGLGIGIDNAYRFVNVVEAQDQQAGQPAVPSEIVNGSRERVETMQTAGEATPQPSPTIAPDDMSVFISQAVQEFLPDHKSEGLMIMHCLAHRENGHAANRNCGDSGKACGPFQFWQPTWEGMRKIMIKEGKATEIGDRYDKKESARTTAWALADGREMNWGPIKRSSEGSNFAACPVPSWSKSK